MLNDKSSAVIFQAAEKRDYKSLSAFVANVTSLELRHDQKSNLVKFTSLDGTALSIKMDSVAVPWINSEPVDLSPSTMPLYEGSPYMSAKWGDTKFEIKAPGLLGDDGQPIEKSVLDFSGSWK